MANILHPLPQPEYIAITRDAESEYLDLLQEEEDAMGAIVGASITYRLGG